MLRRVRHAHGPGASGLLSRAALHTRYNKLPNEKHGLGPEKVTSTRISLLGAGQTGPWAVGMKLEGGLSGLRIRGPTGEMSTSGLRNCENDDCIVGSRARYKVYTGGADPLRQSHVLAHTRATPAFTKRHDNVQPPLGARARGDAELATGHREGAINRYRSRRQRRRAQSEPVHASGQHFTRATLAPQ